MIVYTELENGYLSEGGRTIPNDPANRDYATALQQVIDLEATITPYAGSPEELADAIAEKVQEIKQEFFTRHGMQIDLANQIVAYFDPLDPPTAASTKFHADIGIADVAIVFVSALLVLATVQAYDASTDPGWTA